ESEVPVYSFEMYKNEAYPELYSYKYPKVGENSAVVSVHNFDLQRGRIQTIDVGENRDFYIPRLAWTKKDNKLCIMKLNRYQNKVQLLLSDVRKNEYSILLDESNPL